MKVYQFLDLRRSEFTACKYFTSLQKKRKGREKKHSSEWDGTTEVLCSSVFYCSPFMYLIVLSSLSPVKRMKEEMFMSPRQKLKPGVMIETLASWQRGRG